ncbi:MAG: hypothetical protein HOP10_03490 [Chitinophagaceae bacterium]|nr:hypothetical protein [Chitinophagaceae bacterium]
MSSNFTFWIWGAIIAMALSALFHSLSFIAKPKPRNDTEKQLLDLLTNYKMDMGGGIKRSFGNLFIGVSICFTFIYILGAVLNFYFLRTGISPAAWEGFLLIQVIVYGLVFLAQIRFTFWPPIIVTGVSFIFLLGSYIFK